MPTTTFWTGNAAAVAMVQTATVTAVANNATLTATINGKTITYTCTNVDTTSTAAAAFQALLSANTVPAELGEITFTVSNNIVTATAVAAGTPFAGITGNGLAFSAAGGASVVTATTQANVSQSDVANAQNWSRGGSAQLPQNGDDVIVADSSIPLLWNLDQLAAVQMNSFTRWQSFSGTIGLPENNPLGYTEWRQTYFKLGGNGAKAFPMLLGQGVTGSGPGRERYNVSAQQTALTVLASGSALDDYAIRFLGTSSLGNTLTIIGTSVGVAMLPAEVSTLATVTVDGNGTVALGAGVSWSGVSQGSSSSSAGPQTGVLTLINGGCTLYTNPGTISVQAGSTLVCQASGALQYPTITAVGGSSITWQSDGNITALTLTSGATFDKSSDLRPITITTAVQDGDTTQISDPNNTITYTNPATVTNAVSTGPFVAGPGRKWKLT